MAQMWNLLAGYAGLVSFGHQVFVGIGAYGLFLISDSFDLSLLGPAGRTACLRGGRRRDRPAAVSAARGLFLDRHVGVLRDYCSTRDEGILARRHQRPAAEGEPARRPRLVPTGDVLIAGTLALGSLGGLFLLMRSGFGLGLMSVRDNDLGAMSVGVDVQRNRFIVFVLSAAGCGLAGAVSFLGNLYVSPAAAFDVNWVVYMMFIVMIGGIGTLEGPIIGTVIFFGLRELITGQLGFSAGWYLVALGTVAIIVMLWSPRGLWPPLRDRFGLKLLGIGRTAPTTPDITPLADKAAQLG